MPKKPSRNPWHIVFPKKGAVRRVVEEFPREQEDLELSVGRKFVAALQHFEGVDLRDLCRGSEPADLVCKATNGSVVGVQVVEVVDQQLIELQTMRSSYRDALVNAMGKELLLFNGCRVSLIDSGDPPYLPSAGSGEGQVCILQLSDDVRRAATDASTLQVGKMRLHELRIGTVERRVGILIERIALPSDPPRLELSWSGVGPSYRAGKSRGILARAVGAKVSKNYAKPADQSFMLLTYSVDTLFRCDDPDMKEAQSLLDDQNHPFDDAWYFFPYAEQNLGHLVHIWPRESSG